MNQEHTHDHEALAELLPWFVNGTLNEDQQSAVSAHLEICEACRKDVDAIIGVAARFTTADKADLGERPRQAALTFAESLPDQKRTRPSYRRMGMAGVACSIALAGFFATFAFLPETADYRALSSDGSPDGARVIQVVFSDQATAIEIRQTLLADDREVLSGPSQQGVYRVAVAPNSKPGIHLAHLRDNEAVIFAELEGP